MLQTFIQAFGGTFVGVLDIFLIILVAGLLVRRRVVTQAHIDALSTATVVVFLPCLTFDSVVRNLDPSKLPYWWTLPLAAVAMAVAGLALGAALFARELPAKRNMLALASMQNAGYLVLPVGLALFPKEFDRFALYCFLFILGNSLVLWSVGKFLATRGRSEMPVWRALLTPPLVANVAAIALALSGGKALVPEVLQRGVHLLGTAAVPVATFILGAVLGSIPFRLRAILPDAARVVLVKLVLLPLLTTAVLAWTGLGRTNPLLASFFLIQAAAAPAVAIILQVRRYGGDEEKIGGVMLIAYAGCLLALPFWLALWRVLS